MWIFLSICIIVFVIYRLVHQVPPIDDRLLMACSNRDTRDDAFRLIKSNPELVNVATKEGITPLMIASVAGDSILMEELLANGANVNAVTNNGYTALMLVCKRGGTCASVYQLLVESGSTINTRSKEGLTALGYARQGFNVGLRLYLKEKGGVE